VWRPVVAEGVSTSFKEIVEFFDINDLLDLHESMDLIEEANRRAMKKD
jgi:hypothetical protein